MGVGGEHEPLVAEEAVQSYKSVPDDDTNTHRLPPMKKRVLTARHLLVWPATFIFATAFNMTYHTFNQYVYIKLQTEMFPGLAINSTTAYCVDTNSTDYKIQEDVQQSAALWGIYLYLSGSITSIIANFVLGAYTDRFGRKFLFILPCLGTIFRSVWALIGMHYNMPLYFYTVGFFIEGLTGHVFAVFQASYLYAADITTVGKQRSVGMVAIELANGIGTIVPVLVVGMILKRTDSFFIPYYITMVLLGVALVLFSLLPETFEKERRSESTNRFKVDTLRNAYSLFFGKENCGRRWMYLITLTVLVLSVYNLLGRLSMEFLFVLNYPLCWDPEELGIFRSVRNGFQQLVGMGLIIVMKMCMKDETIAIIGCISSGAAFLVEAFATTKLHMYIVVLVGVFGLLTVPMMRSIMSKMTSPQKQGAVFAAIAACETTINLIGAVSSQSIYISTVKLMSGFTFIVFAGFNGISLILMIVFVIGTRRSTKYHTVQ